MGSDGKQTGIIFSSLFTRQVVGEERGPGHSAAQSAASQTLQIFLNRNFSYFPVCIRR